MSLDHTLSFLELIHAFQKVERMVYATGHNRRENDVEHSYQLALVSWYLVKTNNLPLDADKTIRYALIHDLVEVYAGDTYAYTEDIELRRQKVEREREAAREIETRFSEFSDLHRWINAYEEQEDEESRFVYALDKLIPILNIYLDDGKTWKEDGVTLEAILLYKAEKVAVSPQIHKLFNEIIERLRKDEKRLFKKDIHITG